MKKISKRREDTGKKINQGEKSLTHLLIDDKISQWPKRSVNDSYPKHFSLDDNLQNFAEDQGEDFMQEVIFPDLLEVKAAEYEVDQEQIRKQQANIFVPSNSPVANERKLPKDTMPRILEDEGFYIQRKPKIHKKTCNKMENRLLTVEEGKSWFEESGEIMSLPSPIRQSWNFRLNTSKGSLNPALKTIYRKAVKPDLESSMRNKMEGQREMYQLDLNIVGLQFSHHPLFNQEQVLCARLLQLYECFQDRQQQNLPQLLYEKVYEVSQRTNLLAKLYLPLPNSTEVKSKTVLEYVEFSSDELVTPAYGEVGSNVPFILEGNATEELCLLTSGKLSYCLSWALDENGIPLTPKSQSLRSAYCSVLRNVDARGVPGIPRLINARKLFEWANEVKIDPNNPEYSDLMEFVMYMKHKGQDIPKYFRLEQMQDEFNFVSEEEMEKSKRFQLLQLRNAGQLDVFLLQQMPLYDKEIPDLVFQEYETQIEKDIPISDVNSITAQRINSANFLKKMKKLIMRRIVKVSKVNLSDVVADYEEIVSASQLTYAVCKIVERQRKLKPQRKERRKVAAQTICDGDIKILVRILRAYNIPTRNTTVNRALDLPTYLISSVSHLRHKETVKSVSSDEILNEDPYCKSCSSYSHIRKNWLGSIVFPFSALLQQSEISGTFQVNTPPVLLGYTWSKTHASPKEDYNGQNFKESTFLNIFATIEPQISYVTCNPELDKDLIARFVSLIPVVPDVLDENDGFDIWMTSEGQVAYVLTQETDEYLLWNPLTGQCHKQFDPFCPLQSVDCLFDDGNVWFNIQQNNTPMAVHFDYSKESFWKQLLPKDFQGTNAQSIQPEEIIYCETNKSMIEDLKNRIERTLKCKMMEWRPKQPTRWNRQCTYILQKILPKLELGTGSFVLSEEEGEFERLLQFYWVTGFPIQMPYTDVQSIIDAVYQTGIHSSEFPQTEFALAVYIHPYPNNILSVWVYLASLARHE